MGRRSSKKLVGGSSEWALRMLSGKFPTANKITQDSKDSDGTKTGTSTDDIIQLLKANKGKLMTVSIRIPAPLKGLFIVQTNKDSSTESHCITFLNYTIYCNHAYIIDSIDYTKLDAAGDKDTVITLQNPHNTEISTLKFPKVSPLLLKHCASQIVIL